MTFIFKTNFPAVQKQLSKYNSAGYRLFSHDWLWGCWGWFMRKVVKIFFSVWKCNKTQTEMLLTKHITTCNNCSCNTNILWLVKSNQLWQKGLNTVKKKKKKAFPVNPFSFLKVNHPYVFTHVKSKTFNWLLRSFKSLNSLEWNQLHCWWWEPGTISLHQIVLSSADLMRQRVQQPVIEIQVSVCPAVLNNYLLADVDTLIQSL